MEVTKDQLFEKLKRMLQVQNIYEVSDDVELYNYIGNLNESEAVCKVSEKGGRQIVFCATKKGTFIEDVETLLKDE